MKLKRYQRVASSLAARELSTYGTAAIISPTRTGKTIMAIETKRKMGDPPMLVTSPHMEIVYQWAQTARDEGYTASVIGDRQYDTSGQIVCATNDSAYLKIGRIMADRPDIRLLVVDEAHHVMSDSMRHVIEMFERLSHNGKKLLITATPQRADGQDMAQVLDSYPIHVGHGTAYLAGAIKMYHTVQVELDKGMSDENVRKLIDKWKAEGGRNKQSIFFVDRIAHIQTFVNALHKQGVTAAGIYGGTPKKERRRVLDEYDRGTIRVLVNVQVLTEGIDINQTEVIVLASQPATQTPLVQKAGRALGNYHGKGTPTIIIGHVRGAADLTRTKMPDNSVITANRLRGTVAGSVFSLANTYTQLEKGCKRWKK